MTTTILGFKISMPIMIAPTAFQKMAHPEGIHMFMKSNTKDKIESCLIKNIEIHISYILYLIFFFILDEGEYATARAASSANTIMVCN